MNIWNSIEECLYVAVAVQNAWQTQDWEWRIVRMYAHINVVFIADRHNSLQPSLHVSLQVFLCHSVIQCQQLAEQLQRLFVALLEVACYEALSLYDDVIHQLKIFLWGLLSLESLNLCHQVASCYSL